MEKYSSDKNDLVLSPKKAIVIAGAALIAIAIPIYLKIQDTEFTRSLISWVAGFTCLWLSSLVVFYLVYGVFHIWEHPDVRKKLPQQNIAVFIPSIGLLISAATSVFIDTSDAAKQWAMYAGRNSINTIASEGVMRLSGAGELESSTPTLWGWFTAYVADAWPAILLASALCLALVWVGRKRFLTREYSSSVYVTFFVLMNMYGISAVLFFAIQ